MNAKHTPGKWLMAAGKSNIHAKGSWGTVICDGYHICEIWSDGPWYDERKDEPEANARLIAAAPELLEALDDLLNKRGALPERQAKAARAIAKAKGEA